MTEKRVVLNGSDVPADGTANWEWIPHRGQPSIKILVRVWAEENGWRSERLGEDLQSNGPRWHQNNNSLHLTIENVAFEAAGLFTFRQMKPVKKILKQYEIFSIKGRETRNGELDLTLLYVVSLIMLENPAEIVKFIQNTHLNRFECTESFTQGRGIKNQKI